jgi:hypothetical protein
MLYPLSYVPSLQSQYSILGQKWGKGMINNSKNMPSDRRVRLLGALQNAGEGQSKGR